MGAEEEIIGLMRLRGPLLPVDAAKAVKTNLIIAAAHLSELASRQKVKISHLKVGGGSPLYYLPGQESRLQEFAKNLGEKEYRAFEHLRERQVLRDAALEPLMRVSLRNIKDFAVPLLVTSQGGQELFWKWYLMDEEQAKVLINDELEPPAEKQVVEEVRAPQPVAQKEKTGVPFMLPVFKEKEQKKDEQTLAAQEKVPMRHKKKEKNVLDGGLFSQQIIQFFDEKKIRIISEDVLRKDGDISYILDVPSPVGNLRYLCKARQKKRCTDKDLSSALVEGQLKKLPVIFLYTGDLSAKAQELAQTDVFKNITLYKL